MLHVLGAVIWIGGHLILCLRYLPESLKTKNPEIIRAFEKRYEIIGFPSLLLQVITGIWMALSYYNVTLFSFSNSLQTAVSLKLILLALIIFIAVRVRIFVFPKLTENNIWGLAWHIIAVTVISIAWLYLGVSIRFGGI